MLWWGWMGAGAWDQAQGSRWGWAVGLDAGAAQAVAISQVRSDPALHPRVRSPPTCLVATTLCPLLLLVSPSLAPPPARPLLQP